MLNRAIRIIKKASTNKVFAYTITRYVVYAIQFVVSMLCAAKMGPYYYGIWGFIMMILSYMQRIDLGIPNAMNIILVQEKDNPELFSRTQSTGFLLFSFLCVFVALFASGNVIFGYGFMEKYPIGNLFYVVCLIAVISYFVTTCTGIYRVKHGLLEIAISQSIIPLLLLIALFISDGKELLLWFTLAYLVGNIGSLLMYLLRGKLSFSYPPSKSMTNRIVVKGFYLFIYNACFYFILISTRTVISSNFPVEQFGYFTFAFALADAVILMLGAITFLMFPKTISKLNTTDLTQVNTTLKLLRSNYIPLVHLMMYVAFLFFPIITHFIPKYQPALPAIYMVALALIMNSAACGYSDYLMAQNKDRLIATISAVSLFANVGVALFLVKVVGCSYAYVVGATMFSYWLFSILCIYFGMRQMGVKVKLLNILKECFPLRQLIPYLSASAVFFVHEIWILPLPLILFVVFNMPTIRELYHTFHRLLNNPDMLDVKGV